MSKRSLFTQITPLPPGVSREAAIEWLHNHKEMIELNPLVLRHQRCDPHETAPKEEHTCHWYEMTDQINYLPGGLMKGEVTYKAAFHDLPTGLQTHVYAPAGLDLREKWTVCGNMPGEPREPLELGSGVPREGLYIREDVDMRCNIFLSGFVKKNLSKSHKVVVEKVVAKAALAGNRASTTRQEAYTVPEPQELPTSAQDDLQKELPACQCPDGHDPTCSQYVDPTLGRYAEVDQQKTFITRQADRIPYEPFNYVKPDSNDPQLFTGNFHPLSHYQILFNTTDSNQHLRPEAALAQAELPSTASPVTTG